MERVAGLHDRTSLIAYGSETGNAEDVAQELGRLTRRLHFNTHVTELNDIGLNDLVQNSIVIISISTTGQGDLPANSQSLWKRLRSSRLQSGSLDRCLFASFGLGDSSYPNFNWAHRKLHNRLCQLGANVLFDRGEADEQHSEGIDGLFFPWSVQLKKSLIERFPLPKGIEPIPDTAFLEPEWTLQYSAKTNGQSMPISSPSPGSQVCPHQNVPVRVPGSMRAKLVRNDRITPEKHWQDVRMLEFHLPQTPYVPGDVLTIYPQNAAHDVERVIQLMGWSAIANSPTCFVSSRVDADTDSKCSPPITLPESDTKTSLRTILMNNLDINAVPRRSFFAAIAHFTDDETQQERLLDFTKPELVDELYDYTTRPRRSIVEVLQEFDTVKIPFKYAASIFPIIRGRQFSIASGGCLKQGPDAQTRVELLVAIVKYRTVIKKIRQGLCTRYLAALQPGSDLHVVLCKGGMKHSPDRPALMIGPGTGVAPLRSMIHEREMLRAKADLSTRDASQILFFGGRNRDADFFFKSEWEERAGRGDLEVFPAFSRDQKNKVYVQDLIKESSQTVFNMLQEGVVYVCGSSGKMPQSVREALIAVLEKQGPMPRANAEARLVAMEKSGRYQQETW